MELFSVFCLSLCPFVSRDFNDIHAGTFMSMIFLHVPKQHVNKVWMHKFKNNLRFKTCLNLLMFSECKNVL
jgi:hypothetical protein